MQAPCVVPFYKKLYWQVFIGVCLGAILGYAEPEIGASLKVWGDAFIKLIKILIAPIIFCTIVTGMSGMSDMKRMGKIGGISILYFEVVTTIALAFGAVVMNLFPIGLELNINLAQLDTSAVKSFTNNTGTTFTSIILSIIPKSFVGAFSDAEPLQVLFISVVFGFALQVCGGQKGPLYGAISNFTDVLFKMVEYFMKLAPIGAFCAMAFTVGKFGISSLIPLLKFVALFWATSLAFIVGVIGGLLAYHKISIFKLISYIRDEVMVTIGTCTSEAVLPRILTKLQELGVRKETAGLVLPAGMAFNLDGTCLYFTMAATFLAQATHTPFPISTQLTLFMILLVASKGANAVYGSAFIILGSTLGALGSIPVESMAILLGIDRFIAMARAVTNVISNCAATLLISRYTGELQSLKL